jgi:hypothetical protein
MIIESSIDKYIDKFQSILEIIKCNINDFNTKYKIHELFNDKNYYIFYNYLQNIRLFNVLIIINQLLYDYKQKDDKQNLQLNFCNQIKIFNDIFNYKNHKFKYKFEAFFEFISGVELQTEQMKRYIDIINSFIEYENNITHKSYEKYDLINKEYNGKESIIDYIGGGFNYPLHHIMMSKGKSAILSPLLALHLVLIYNKQVYIIVPEHLERTTIKKFDDYMNFFNCINKINVYSDSKIKNLYLNGKFKDEDKNKDIVMIIDEFDSLIDPIKSNYNVTLHKVPFDKELCDFIKIIVLYLRTNEKLKINEIKDKLPDKFCDYYEIIEFDINNILKQINENILIENITWGIHPEYYYAIPYNNKDKPLLSSNFTSSIMTLFLTYYYYIIIQNYSINDYIIEIIIKNNLLLYIGYDITINREDIIKIFDELHIELKNKLFDEIFKIIFKRELLSINQSNVSFIDIINIKNIFKIGYSGTVNINLEPLEYLEDKFNTIIPDYDEELNVKNAIINAEIKYLNKSLFKSKQKNNYLEELNLNVGLIEYRALIDLYGLFKNIKNQDIAIQINKLLGKIVIYLHENDKEYIINKEGNREDYNENKFYEDPFLFFDQGHTIGVDIKQDKYPIIKGLCIIDNKINYTQIAQAIFRLRKINLGHTINFCYIKNEHDDNIDIDILYESFLRNDKIKKELTNDFLIYQILKYEIRKNNQEENIMKKHNEIIKYYYKSETKLPLKTNLDDFFIGIFTFDELAKIKSDNKLFDKIYNYDKLIKLIYNIDSISIDHTQQSELDEQTEQNRQVEKMKKQQITISETHDQKLDNKIIYPQYDFLIYHIFKAINNDSFFKIVSIKVDELIYCLPNIFIQIDGFKYYKNTSGFLFVYINDKLLIIPGYMLTQFMYDYPIFNIELIIVNNNLCKNKFNYHEIIKKIESHKIFMDIRKQLTFNKENILLYFIMINIQNELDININIHKEEINILNELIKQIYDCWINEHKMRKKVIINNEFKIENINKINNLFMIMTGLSNIFFQKYLKYKIKYINLVKNQ